MLMAILIILILNLFLILIIPSVTNSGVNARLFEIEYKLNELLEELKDPNYHGTTEDGNPYTISKH